MTIDNITLDNITLYRDVDDEGFPFIKTAEYSDAMMKTVSIPTKENMEIFKKATTSLKDISFTFSNCNINADLFSKLCGTIPPKPEKYIIITKVFVQRRKHHKNRINKKWAKRYGFKEKFYYYNVADINSFLIDKETAIHEFNLDNVKKCYLVDENQFDLYNLRNIFEKNISLKN